MIATCPQCSTRYKIAEDKIKGQKARITCRRCQHKFVIDREVLAQDVDAAPSVPDHAPASPAGDIGLPVTIRRDGHVQRAEYEEDDENDVPTTVMPHGSSVIRQIRDNVPAPQASTPVGGELPSSDAQRARPVATVQPGSKLPARPSRARYYAILAVLFLSIVLIAFAVVILAGQL